MKIEKIILSSIQLLQKKKNDDEIFFFFVKSLLVQYLSLIKELNEGELSLALEEHGFWIGKTTKRRFANLISRINVSCLNILQLCYKGDIWQAGAMLEKFLCSDKGIKRYLVEPIINSFKTSLTSGTPLYRMRDVKIGERPEDCWHVPFPLRRQTQNYRYSMAGLPCLYLADSPETANLEVGKLRSGRNRWIGKFIPQKTLMYLNLEVPNDDTIKCMDNAAKINFLLSFPIILLCSVKKTKTDSFHEEYYFPQLMMYCLCLSDNEKIQRYNGIKYNSTLKKDSANYVLPARYKGNRPPTYNYSKELLEAFKTTTPVVYSYGKSNKK